MQGPPGRSALLAAATRVQSKCVRNASERSASNCSGSGCCPNPPSTAQRLRQGQSTCNPKGTVQLSAQAFPALLASRLGRAHGQHSLVPLHIPDSWRAHAARSYTKEAVPLIMDAPWTMHIWKILAW